MRRTTVALTVNAIWAAALAAAGAGFWLLGANWVSISIASLLIVAAAGSGFLAGRAFERKFQKKLGALGAAVGVAGGQQVREGISIEAIVSNLATRLERASQFKTAFSGMRQPALLISADGEILGSSRGLLDLAPLGIEGGTLDDVFGDGTLDGGGLPEEMLAMIGGVRFETRRRGAGSGRALVELTPAGHFLSDDELDAFAGALSGGQTGFRFDSEALARSPALRSLEGGLSELDQGVRALERLGAGERVSGEMLWSNSGIAPQVRVLSDLLGALQDDLLEETKTRRALETNGATSRDMLERYRTVLTSMAEAAGGAKATLTVAGQAVERGRDRIKATRTSGKEIRSTITDAARVAERTSIAVTGLDRANGEIDRMVAAIEDVSFRTNLLALNAAVEAARAGEKGAGFAVVADEVRMLAQLTQKTSRDIRALVVATRGQSAQGMVEADNLKTMLEGLGRHIDNLGNDTDTISVALEEGSGAVSRLGHYVATVEELAGTAMAVPARRADRA